MPERPGLLRRALADAIATFALVFAGCRAVVTDATHQNALRAVGVSLVFGLVKAGGARRHRSRSGHLDRDGVPLRDRPLGSRRSAQLA
jgi:hypothetical protein